MLKAFMPKRMCYTHRHLFVQLALELIKEGKNDKALKVLRKAEKVLPNYNVPNTFVSGSADLARAYALLGQKNDAKRLLNEVWDNTKSYADYYVQLDGSRFDMCSDSLMRQLYVMQADKWATVANNIYKMYQMKGGQPYEMQ